MMHRRRGQIGTLALAASLAAAWYVAPDARGADWPQWCGTDGKNLVSSETGLPESFAPGEKDLAERTVNMATATNVAWGVKLGDAFYSTPSVAGGKVFVGGREGKDGIFVCFDAATGRRLWQWKSAPRDLPRRIDGFEIGLAIIPQQIGVCSSPAIAGDRVYFVDNRCNVVCMDAGDRASESGDGLDRVVWSFDAWEKLGVFPCDAANGSPLILGDLLYVPTCNGVDRNTFKDPAREKDRKLPSPEAPNLIVLDRRDGRLVATDDTPIMQRVLHGQWSAPSAGVVDGRRLVFYGGGDGRCYAFEALDAVPGRPVKLKTAWSYDCIPAEYKDTGGLDWITRYCLGDRRCTGALNKANDGAYAGESEIIATPVFVNGRVYVAIGRDPAHGRGRGALHCIDPRGRGDITASGRIWTYQGLDRTISTVSVAGGLLYICDLAGRLHCLDADTGRVRWVYETRSEVWGSTLVADGRVYMPTAKGIDVLAAGPELRELAHIALGGKVYASPVVANGTLYVATTTGWLWAVRRD